MSEEIGQSMVLGEVVASLALEEMDPLRSSEMDLSKALEATTLSTWMSWRWRSQVCLLRQGMGTMLK
jgi:hypothetical protein